MFKIKNIIPFVGYLFMSVVVCAVSKYFISFRASLVNWLFEGDQICEFCSFVIVIVCVHAFISLLHMSDSPKLSCENFNAFISQLSLVNAAVAICWNLLISDCWFIFFFWLWFCFLFVCLDQKRMKFIMNNSRTIQAKNALNHSSRKSCCFQIKRQWRGRNELLTLFSPHISLNVWGIVVI